MALNLRQAMAGYLRDLQDTAVNAMLQQAEAQAEALSSEWSVSRGGLA